MKWQSLLGVLLALCLVSGCSTPGTAPKPDPSAVTPGPGSTEAPNLEVRALRMLSASDGWLLARTKLWRTNDGGKSWSDVTPKGVSFEDGFFVDGSSAWLLTDKGILRTTDGGHAWEQLKAPFEQARLAFADRTHGWAMVSRGVATGNNPVDIFATEDGGKRWSRISGASPQEAGPGALPMGGLKDDIAFRDEKVGWIVGQTYALGKPWIYETKDGGRTWSPLELPIPMMYDPAQLTVLRPLLMGEQGTVLPIRAAREGKNETFFMVTGPGEQGWNSSIALEGWGPAAWADRVHGWFWDGTALRLTDEGGRTWSPPDYVKGLSDVRALAFGSNTNGVAVTPGGVMRTEDGGKSWTKVPLP